MYKFLFVVLLSIIISGCSLLDPWVYKISKQQGNITEQKLVDKLEIGMSREQVRFLLGTPMSVDAFNEDRWDYIYTFKIGNNEVTHHNLTIYFEDHKLTKIDGEAFIKNDSKRASDELPEELQDQPVESGSGGGHH